jgi:hypothetical protein
MSRLPLLALFLFLLTGCAATPSWTKPGADAAVSERDYQECRAGADAAVRTEADIDQDISATRQSDWQRAGIGRVQTQTMREMTRDRGTAIFDACMRSKGFTEAR